MLRVLLFFSLSGLTFFPSLVVGAKDQSNALKAHSEAECFAAAAKLAVETKRSKRWASKMVQNIVEWANAAHGPQNRKMVAQAIVDFKNASELFEKYKNKRKITIFGSARTRADSPSYSLAEEIAHAASNEGMMVITGGGSGIMEAGNKGAKDLSFGLNILLPFEQALNPYASPGKTMRFKYFFARKVFLIKESDAILSFPGGFGTFDEAFEALTLIQTGKSPLIPMILVDPPDHPFWNQIMPAVENAMLNGSLQTISPDDRSLYKIVKSKEEALREINHFYSSYHSMEYDKQNNLHLRLKHSLSESQLADIKAEYGSLVAEGEMIQQELNKPGKYTNDWGTPSHELIFKANKKKIGTLRKLVDSINDLPH